MGTGKFHIFPLGSLVSEKILFEIFVVSSISSSKYTDIDMYSYWREDLRSKIFQNQSNYVQCACCDSLTMYYFIIISESCFYQSNLYFTWLLLKKKENEVGHT